MTINLSLPSLSWILTDWILTSVLSALVIAILGVLIYFLVPSLKLWLELRRITSALTKLRSDAEKANQAVDPAVISRDVMRRGPFRHLRAEYSETLHAQYDLVNGQNKLVARRATVPAEMDCCRFG